MPLDGTNSIRNFFKCMGGGFFVLSIKAVSVEQISFDILRTLFFTFMYIFIVSIWIGLAGMFAIDIYLYLKSKIL